MIDVVAAPDHQLSGAAQIVVQSKRQLKVNTSDEVEPSLPGLREEDVARLPRPRKKVADGMPFVKANAAPIAKEPQSGLKRQLAKGVSPSLSSCRVQPVSTLELVENRTLLNLATDASSVGQHSREPRPRHRSAGPVVGRLAVLESGGVSSKVPLGREHIACMNLSDPVPRPRTEQNTKASASTVSAESLALAKCGNLSGHVQVQWYTKSRARQMTAEKGAVSRKGLQLRLVDGRLVASTRGLARDIELSAATVTEIHSKYASEGKATLVVEEDLGGDSKNASYVLLSKMDPGRLLHFLEHLRL